MEWKIAGIVFLAFALFAGFCVYQNQKRKRYLMAKIRKSWGERPVREYSLEEFAAIGRYYELKKKDGFTVDDITWNDLDMDTIFMLLNHTWSCIGESYLYSMLRTPSFSKEELEQRNRLIQYFAEHEEERQRFEYFFARIGKTGSRSVFDYIYNLAEYQEEPKAIHVACIAAILSSLAVLVLNPAAGIMPFVIALSFSWWTYFKRRKKVEPYVLSCNCLLQILKAADNLLKGSEAKGLSSYLENIRQARKRFDKFKRNSYFFTSGNVMSSDGDLVSGVLAYINLTFHLDLIQFSTMVHELRTNMDAFETLVENIGMLESAIAIASFREMMGEWCLPSLERTNRVYLRAEELYHPMIDDPVKNSISTGRGVLITGSNASGKSTFLKTVAINAVLAQTIYTVLADRWESNCCQIYSSMALRDDLIGQESYYIVEIKSLKRILDHMEDELPLLCFVDEVLRGTNTVERIAASAQILKGMGRDNVMCFAATHDIELTFMLEKLYDNCHFQEEVVEDDILFNYQLYEGRATSRNAIRLLGIMGYEEKIIGAAEASAQRFMETGDWSL